MAFSILEPHDERVRSRPDDLTHALDQLGAARIGRDAVPKREAIQRFCRAHPDALHRSCVDGHLTGSALVFDPGTGETLLLHHAKLDRWLQPGGHADGDGNLAAVALREATEETGIGGLRVVVPAVDVDVHVIPARGTEPEHLHLDLRFLVLAPSGAEVDHNHEALGARWVRPDDPVLEGGELVRAVGRALEVTKGLNAAGRGG